MDRFCSVSSRLFAYLAIVLLVLGALAVPSQSILADDGGPGGGPGGGGSGGNVETCQPTTANCGGTGGTQSECFGKMCANMDRTKQCQCDFSGGSCDCP